MILLFGFLYTAIGWVIGHYAEKHLKNYDPYGRDYKGWRLIGVVMYCWPILLAIEIYRGFKDYCQRSL